MMGLSSSPPGHPIRDSVPESQWSDWRWQLGHSLSTAEEFEAALQLSPSERQALERVGDDLPEVSVTPYFLSLMSPTDPRCPLRRQALPDPEDLVSAPGEGADPLGERPRAPVNGLIHRYRDRVVLLVSSRCALRCRHCNRRARGAEEFIYGPEGEEAALAYVSSHPEVREAILSGGDPLTLSDEALDRWLSRLRRIPHLELLRVHTRMPATCPMRVTPDLVRLLSRHGPLYLLTQFNHPREVTDEAREACERLAEAGIPLANQSVLLRGVNSDLDVLTDLSRALLRARVRPYYLFQLDPVVGTERFKTPVAAGIELVGRMRGRLSGLGIPSFVLDAPGGHGKVALLPESILGTEPGRLRLRTSSGAIVDYPDTGAWDLEVPA
ncbi:MAG: KamA family radical SAM protein [Polyangia bacterium]|nr:KamA family radical SAM protein [Polyangia bacterium]